MKKLHIRYIVLATMAIMGSEAMAGNLLRQNIIRSNTPSAVYGAYFLGETQPTVNPNSISGVTGPTRNAGGYAISPNTGGLSKGTASTAFGLLMPPQTPQKQAHGISVMQAPDSNLFIGAISDGSSDTASGTGFFGAGFGQYDLLGFTVSYSTKAPGKITVTRRVVANALGASDATGTTTAGYVNEMAVGSLATNGDIALKVLISGNSSNSFGLINATSPATSVFTTSYSAPTNAAQWRQIVETNTGGSNMSDSIQSVGSTNGWVLTSAFSKQIVAGSTTSTSSGAAPAPGGPWTPHGRVVATITSTTQDNRGSITYNDKIGLAAVLRTITKSCVNPNGGSNVNVNHCTAVAVYKVTFDGSGNPELRDLTGALSTIGTEVTMPQAVLPEPSTNTNSVTQTLDLVGTNYFGSTGFQGPAQVAMNDKGDIAVVAVAVNRDDISDTSQNQERGYRPDKRYIVNHYNGSTAYNGWVTAATSGTNSLTTDGSGNMFSNKGTGDFVSVNPALPPPGNGAASIAATSPSLDNKGNVYFQACYSAEEFAGFTGSTYHPAVFRSKTSDGINYTTEEVLAEEDTITNPAGSGLGQRITFMPMAVATSSLLNLNIRFPATNSFSTVGAQRDGDGRLVVACKLTDPADDPNNNTLPSRWNFILVDRK